MAETCGFGNQSLEPFHCGPQWLRLFSLHPQGHPFSRSYEVNLPNSLTKVLPFALVFSTCPPVSVCGTVTQVSSLRGFSWQPGPVTSACRVPFAPRSPRTDFPARLLNLHAWPCFSISRVDLPHCVPPSLLFGGSGILTRCPSPTPCGLGLGPTNPTRTALPSETLDFRRIRFSRISRYSCQHSHFCTLHCSSRYSFLACRTLPYQRYLPVAPRGFGAQLSPVTFSAQNPSTSELLRTL